MSESSYTISQKKVLTGYLFILFNSFNVNKYFLFGGGSVYERSAKFCVVSYSNQNLWNNLHQNLAFDPNLFPFKADSTRSLTKHRKVSYNTLQCCIDGCKMIVLSFHRTHCSLTFNNNVILSKGPAIFSTAVLIIFYKTFCRNTCTKSCTSPSYF